MTRHALVTDMIRGQGRELKMPGLVRGFESLARQAKQEQWSYEDYLFEVLAIEITSRSESSIRHRVREARFPELKTLDEFDFKIADGIEQAVIAELAKGKWIDDAENLILAGPDRHWEDAPRDRTRS